MNKKDILKLKGYANRVKKATIILAALIKHCKNLMRDMKKLKKLNNRRKDV